MSVLATSNDNDDNEEELLSAMKEKEFDQMQEEVLNKISIKHPIVYDMYNICDMVSMNKLSKFSIAVLQEICIYFELDIPSVQQKRRKPYLDVLSNLVQSCTCQKR